MKDKSKGYYYLPNIYIKLQTRIPSKSLNTICLEDLIKLAQQLDLDIKDVLMNYSSILITLLWAAQVYMNSDLTVNTKIKNNSRQKTFQQTESHARMAKIIANSEATKQIISLSTIQLAINKDLFGICPGETDNEGYLNTIANSFEELRCQRGSGSTKTYVRDPETRMSWMRATNSSLRSTWCATVVYSPNKLASIGISIKTTKPIEVFNFLNKTFDDFVKNGIISSKDKPNEEEIRETCLMCIDESGINRNIDDSAYGDVKFIPLEEIFKINRQIGEKIDRKRKLPGIAFSLKSEHLKPKDSIKHNLKKKEAENEITIEGNATTD